MRCAKVASSGVSRASLLRASRNSSSIVVRGVSSGMDVAAILAGAAQDDIVRRHDVSASVGDSLDRRLERGVFERLDLPAVVTDEMVMMVAARVGRLEARDSVSEVDSLDESEVGHAVERAVDARDPDLLAEEFHDDAASTSAATARLA